MQCLQSQQLLVPARPCPGIETAFVNTLALAPQIMLLADIAQLLPAPPLQQQLLRLLLRCR
jgi:hypothetical protein